MKLPPYTHGFVDRHGKPRFYFRRVGFKSTPLSGLPWSEEFMAAYNAARAGQPAPIGVSRTKSGTVNVLAIAFYQSAQFKGLSTSTQQTYRGIIERFRNEHGEKRVATLGRRHIVEMLGKKVDKAAAANNWLRMVRMLMQFAVEQDLRDDNPTIGVKPIRHVVTGFRDWPEEHVAAFEAFHKVGTVPRLAFDLLIYTMQRRGDVVRLGRQHVRDGVLSFKQGKTGAEIDIPVLPPLQASLEAMPGDRLTFIVTDDGKPFTPAGFGNWFRDQCALAGVPKGYSAHGLRKRGASRLADAECTDHEIMAWGGWKTLKEVQRYTRGANRKRLAVSAARKLNARTESGKP